MKSVKNIFMFLLIVGIIFFAGCRGSFDDNYPAIEKGNVNLTHWDFQTAGNIKLDGPWEFYWNRLLSYRDLTDAKPDLFASVPNTWNTYSLNGKEKLPGQGCATYRLHVVTNLPQGTMLGLRVYNFSSAYRLYINEKMIASNGRVSPKASDEIGAYRPLAAFFNIPGPEFDIIIQASNFHYARGGFWYSIFMGDPEGISDLHDSLMGKEVFLLGALLVIFLFFMAIFFLRQELRYTLYFALLCLFVAIAIDMVGQFIIPRLFPGLSFNTIIFIWYSSTTWVLFSLILFVHELYTSTVSDIVLKAYLLISLVCQLLYVFTKPDFYSQFAFISNYIDIIGVICAGLIVAIGIKKRKISGWLNAISVLIVLVTYIHDILYWTNVINSDFGEIFYLGLFLFIFIQMVIQADRTKLFHEQKVAAELAFLQAQIKPHFLFNALNTFISISHYDMEKARNLLTSFSNYLRRSFDFKELSQFVPLKNEIELAKAYVEIEKARFEERIEVTFEVPEDLETRVPNLMLQPLIENAVIHGILPKLEGGRIEISIKEEGKMLLFKVKDNGVGMVPKESKKELKQGAEKGVGLTNIDARLRKLFGKGLKIISSPEVGTEITWCIPLNCGGD